MFFTLEHLAHVLSVELDNSKGLPNLINVLFRLYCAVNMLLMKMVLLIQGQSILHANKQKWLPEYLLEESIGNDATSWEIMALLKVEALL